jgi:hypothetical protein
MLASQPPAADLTDAIPPDYAATQGDPTQPILGRPTTLGENFGAGYERSFLVDNSDANQAQLRRAYEPIIAALMDAEREDYRRGRGGPFLLRNPADVAPREAFGSPITRGLAYDSMTGWRSDMIASIWRDVARRRQADPRFLSGIGNNHDEVMRSITARDQTRLGQLDDVYQRSTAMGAIMNFAGGFGGALQDPINLLTMPWGFGFGRSLVGRLAAAGATAATVETALIPVTHNNYRILGVDLTLRDHVMMVGTSFAGGAAFRGTFMALGAGAGALARGPVGQAMGAGYDAAIAQAFRAMPENVQARWAEAGTIGQRSVAEEIRARTPLTSDERAAADALIRDAEIREANPFRSDVGGVGAHVDRLRAAIDQVLADNPAPSRAELMGTSRFAYPDGQRPTPSGYAGERRVMRNGKLRVYADGDRTPVGNAAEILRQVHGVSPTSHRRGANHPLTRANPGSWHSRSGAAVDVAPIRGMTFEQFLDGFRQRGYTIIEALDETGAGRTPHATGDHWHVVLGEALPGGPPRAQPGQPARAGPRGTSGGGTSRGDRNNNPGNLVDGPFARRQPGYQGSDGRFARYATREQGIAAQETLLANNYLDRPRSAAEILERYAPAGPENPAAARTNYIAHIERRLGLQSGERISRERVAELAEAMREFETGGPSPRGSAGALPAAAPDEAGPAPQPWAYPDDGLARDFGDFGTARADLAGDWEGAVAQLLRAQEGHVPGALSHPAIGDIALAWGRGGRDGYGLARLLETGEDAALDGLPAALPAMRVTRQSASRAILDSEDGLTTIRLDYDRARDRWVLAELQTRLRARSASEGAGQPRIGVRGRQPTPARDEPDAGPSTDSGAVGRVDQENDLPPPIDMTARAGKRMSDAERAGKALAIPQAGPSLVEWIAEGGGIVEGVRRGPGGRILKGELRSMDAQLWHRQRRYRRPLVRSPKPGEAETKLDELLAAAIEQGFFPEYMHMKGADAGYDDLPSINVLLDAIEAELRDPRRALYPIDQWGVVEEVRERQAFERWESEARARLAEWEEEGFFRFEDMDADTLADAFRLSREGEALDSALTLALERASERYAPEVLTPDERAAMEQWNAHLDEVFGTAARHVDDDAGAGGADRILSEPDRPSGADARAAGAGGADDAQSGGSAAASGAAGDAGLRGTLSRFDDPDGDGARVQAQSLEHDLRMEVDPNAAAKARQEAELRAASPLRPGAVDQDGTMGLGLFDAADQPRFRLDAEGEPRSLDDILRAADDEAAAIKAIRDCME